MVVVSFVRYVVVFEILQVFEGYVDVLHVLKMVLYHVSHLIPVGRLGVVVALLGLLRRGQELAGR